MHNFYSKCLLSGDQLLPDILKKSTDPIGFKAAIYQGLSFLSKIASISFFALFLFAGFAEAQTTVTLNASPKVSSDVTFTLSGDASVGTFGGGAYSFPTPSGVIKTATITINKKIYINSVYFSWGTNVQGAVAEFYDGASLVKSLSWPAAGTTSTINATVDKIVFKNNLGSNNGLGELQKITYTTAPVNTAPTASNVSITGLLKEGQTLTSTYSYADAESNAENGSVFKWYRSDNALGANKAVIANATSTTYTLTTTDVTKYISFEVTPKDGTAFGTAVESTSRGPVTNAVLLSSNPTISFSSNYGFTDNIAQDGDGGSNTISDLNLQIYPINSFGLMLSAEALEIHGSDWGYPSSLTYGGNASATCYGWKIKSDDGSNFSLESLNFFDWGNWNGATFAAEAFDNGVSKGKITFPGNTTPAYVQLSEGGNLSNAFKNIDEIRVYQNNGSESYIGLNGIKVSTLEIISPTITSSTYDANTGVLSVTGTNMTTGDTVDPSKLTITGEGGTTYTLTSASVTASSSTAFSVTLNSTDKAAVNQILNKNGTVSTSTNTYNLAAAANWDITASATADLTGNGITVSNVVPPVSGTTVITSVACNGGSNGSINLTPTGGTGPYTFSWGGGVTTEDRTGLAAGNYTVTITDANSNIGTVTATITQPAAITASISSQTNVACNGGSNGSATVTASGGTGTKTYSWAPSGGTAATATGLAAGTYTVTITDANGCTATKSVTITQPAAPVSATSVVTNVACNGGSNGAINLTPTGGTGPYTYNWGGGITTEDRTGLAAGTYTVTITDVNGCTGTVNVTITQPTALSASTVVTNVACFGGSNGAINLTPSGGTAPYTFSWGGGVTTEDRTGLAAGTYSVTITDANACTKTISATITQPAAPVSATSVVTNVACNGGSNGAINLTPTGGTGPYTYSWGGGITTEDRTGLAAGTYTATITDVNGCTGTVSVTVTQPAAITASISSQTNVSCNGGSNGSATVTASGGTGTKTYSWAPSGGTAATATGLAAGTYTVTITDANSCTATVSVTIIQPTALSASTVVTNVACFGGSNGAINLTPSGGTAPYTFSWGGGVTTEDRTGLAAGTYSVTITDANACTKTISATITQPTAPVSGTTVVTNIACNGGSNGAINLTPSGGTSPYTYSWGGGITTEDRTGLAAGTYTVTITDANACTGTVSVTVTQPTAPISATSVVTNIACNGGTNGSINLTPTGGTGPYTYSWGGGITTEDRTSLAAGTYTVTITDANACTGTVSVTVTQPTAITASITSQTNVACNGGSNGSATVTATGGTGTKTYSWAPSGGTAATATGLAAGTYTVTITDANSCTATKSVTITQPTALSASITSQTNVACNGGSNGSATVTATGGTGTKTYSWAPSGGTAATATGLAAGTYTVTITDANSCTATASVTITQPTALIASAGSQTNVSCNGESTGSATVSVTGGTGSYSYLWSPAGGTAATATGLAAGTYTVTVTDANNCSTTQSFTITQPAALTLAGANLSTATTAVSYNQSVSASGATGSYTYAVSSGSLPLGLTLSSNGTLSGSPLEAGTFTFGITATDTNCGSTAAGSFNLNVNKGTQSISFNAISSKIYGDADFTLGNATTSAGLAITYTASDPTIVSVTGNTAHILKAGSTNIMASQAGNAHYNGAVPVTQNLSVAKADLVVLNNGRSKVYGSTLSDADFTGSISGVIAGDNITLSRSSEGATSRATVAGSPYSIIAILHDPDNKLINYNVTNTNASLTITKANLTIENTSRSKIYGEGLTNADFAGSITGLVAGDNISITRSSTGELASAAAGTTYPIVATINDADNRLGNYTVSNANAALTVNKKPLIITADNKNKFAGTANPALTVSYIGFVNGEDKSVLSQQPLVSTTAVLLSPIGDYPITASGALADNYAITYNDGVLTVKPGAPTSISLASATVYENTASGTIAGTLSSTSDDPSATFTYSLVSGNGSTDNSLFTISGNQIRTAAPLNFEQKAVYVVRVRSTTQHGFSLDKELSISISDVNEQPTIADIADQTICYTTANQKVNLSGISAGPDAGQSTTVSVSSTNNALFKSLNVSQTSNGNAQLSYEVANSATGSAVVTVLVRDNGGTANGGSDMISKSFTITVNALPEVSISSNIGTTLSKGQIAELTAASTGTYQWANANGIISGQNTATLTVRPEETTTYTVTVTNANGCSSEQSITIVVNADYEVVKGTNIISPNGDGINDKFIIKNIDMYPKNEVKIFDRAGRLLYSQQNYTDQWDGTLNGSPLAEDTYYYVVDFGPTIPRIKGFITIVKD